MTKVREKSEELKYEVDAVERVFVDGELEKSLQQRGKWKRAEGVDRPLLEGKCVT